MKKLKLGKIKVATLTKNQHKSIVGGTLGVECGGDKSFDGNPDCPDQVGTKDCSDDCN